MNRRDFLKFLGAAGLAASYPSLTGAITGEESVVQFYEWKHLEGTVEINGRIGPWRNQTEGTSAPNEKILALMEKRIKQAEEDLLNQLNKAVFDGEGLDFLEVGEDRDLREYGQRS